MNKILIISLILNFFFSILNAEIIKKIEINGNKRISDETIKVYGEFRDSLGQDLSKSDLDRILKNLYLTDFFENVSIEIINNTLTVDLKEYPVVNQLIIVGEKSTKLENEIKKIIRTKEKNSFIENNLKQDVTSIKNLYSTLGYNFSEVEAKIRKVDEDNIDLIFKVERGKITKIRKISFTGDKKLKDKRLRDIIASQEDKFWKFISRNTRFSENLVNLDTRLLINYYKSIGYYDVQVNSTSADISESSDINLNFNINSGQRYFIDKISTNVDPVFDKNLFFPLKEIYKETTGDYYSPFKIKKILKEIDNLIELNNLQFVEHRVKESINNDKISLVFDIFEGEKVLIERINVLGNSVTNEDVVRSELLLDEGDPFTNLSLDKSISKIKSRKIFKTVKPTVSTGSSSDLKIIDIRVEEQPTGEISAGAGVGTEGGTFATKISENNWLGQGKILGLEFELTSESIKGELNYTDPNYDLLGNSINYRLANISNDKPDQGYENTIFTAGVGTSFEQYRNIFTNLALNATYDDLRTNDTASNSLKKQKGEFSEITGEYGFTLDKRDRAFAPTDGSIVGFSQNLPLYADKPFISNTFFSSSYHSFGENIIGAGKIFVDAINGLNDEDVRLSKRKALSSKRLRGFQKGKVGPVDGTDHVGGNYAAAVNIEASLPNLLPDNTNADFGLFLDIANVWGVDYDSTINESNELRSSTGVAVDWSSPIGPISFIFATNLSKASTDKTESFNFNLGTSF